MMGAVQSISSADLQGRNHFAATMARKTSSNKRWKPTASGGRPSETSPAAELIASNVDLLTEILVRLPAKSLIRFKSVSRHWLSLISHSHFSATHSSRNPSPPISGLYFYQQGRLESVSLQGHKNLPSLSFLDGREGIDHRPFILNSCNGLCLCGAGSSDYVVCNLATQKYKVLPKPSGLSCRTYLHRSAYLAFDPLKSPHYKVIVGSHYYRNHSEPWSFEIDMYNSEGGNWKKILPPGPCWGRSVFWNGAIYWISKSKSKENVLLRFNVDAEEIIALPFPSIPRNRSHETIKYFGECGGRLILIQNSTRYFSRFAILELESDTQIVKYWVNLGTAARPSFEMGEFEFYVLCIVEGEEKNYPKKKRGEVKGNYTLVLSIPGKVISYNLKCNTWDMLLDLGPGELIDDDKSGCAYPFLETLSPV